MKRHLFILSVLSAAFAAMLALPLLTSAAPNAILKDIYGKAIGLGNGIDPGTSVSLAECTKTGDCGIEHILLLANSIMRWAVAVSGALALLMYVIGGVWMIFSQGNSSRIERGKDIIIGTSISLIFILGSWLIVSFAVQALGAKPEFQLSKATCSKDTDCDSPLVCSENKQCTTRCNIDKASKDPDHAWACQLLTQCGIASYDDCKGKPNCETDLCPGDRTIVCCYQ